MSAQPSLLLSSRIISSRLLDDTNAQDESSNLDNQADNLNYAILADEQALLKPNAQTDLLIQKSQQTKELLDSRAEELDQAQQNTNSRDAQLDEIEALQLAIISDDNFDLSQLEKPAAGPQDQSSTPSESFAGNAFVETLQRSDTSQVKSNPSSVNSDKVEPVQGFELDNAFDETPLANNALDYEHQSAIEDLRTEISGQIETAYILQNATYETAYGKISYQSDGQWQYTLNNSSETVQSMGASDTLVDSIQLQTLGGEHFALNITIHGSNDRAQITGDKTADIATLSNLDNGERPESISGKLTVSDRDSNEAKMQAEDAIEGTYGQLSINEAGEWKYSLNSELEAIKSLHKDDQLQDLVAVKSADGTSQLLLITINGADDSPLLNGDNSEYLYLEQHGYVEQKLSIDDPDFGQSYFQASNSIQSKSGYGTGSIDEHGNWRYDINTEHPAIESLAEGRRLYDTFVIDTADGTQQTIIIKIIGSDNPFFASDASSSEPLKLDDLLISTEDSNQQALDTYLEHDATLSISNTAQQSHNIETASSEILQQLQPQNFQDNII